MISQRRGWVSYGVMVIAVAFAIRFSLTPLIVDYEPFMFFAPAALIGLPGLFGLVAAIVARIVFIACVRRKHPTVTAAQLDMTQQLSEVCFYLGALATRAYI